MADLSSIRNKYYGFDNLSDDELLSTLQKLNISPDGKVATSEQQDAVPEQSSSTLKDLGYSAAKGIGQTIQGTGWLLGSKGVEDSGREIAQSWADKQSPELKQQLQNVDEAKGFVETAGATLTNPLAFADMIVSSLPAMIGNLGVARLGAEGVAKLAGKQAFTEALAQNATVDFAAKAAQEASKKSLEKGAAWWTAAGVGAGGEGLQSAGMTGSDVEKFYKDKGYSDEISKEAANEAATKAGISTGLLGSLGAKFETDALLGSLKYGGGKKALIDAGKEGLEEGLQGPAEEYAAYEQKKKIDDSQNFDLGKSFAQNTLLGLGMGAPLAGAGYVANRGRDDRPSDDSQLDLGQGTNEANQSTGQGNITPQQFDDITREARASTSYSDGTTQEQNDLLNQTSERIRAQARQAVNPGDIVNPNTSLDESLRVADELVSNAGKTTDNINPIISTLSEQPSQLPVERQQSQPDVIPSPLEGELLPPDAALRQPVAGLIESDAFDQTPEELRAQKNAATRELIQRLSALNKPEAINATNPDNANTTTGTPTGEPTVTPDSRAAAPNPASSEQPDSEVPTNAGESGSATPQGEPVVTNDSLAQSSNDQANNSSEVSNLSSGNETDFATNQESNDVLPANQEKEQETRNTLADIATESQNISKENANQQEANRPESIAAKEAITPPVQDQKANDALDQSVDLSGNQKAIDYFKSKGFTESEANEILDKRSELRKANDLGKLDGYLNGRFDRSRIRNIDNLDPLFDIDNQVDKPKPVVKEPEEQQDSKLKPKPFYQMTLDEYVNNSKASHAKYRPDKPFNEDGAVATYKEIVSNAIRDKKNVPNIALKDYQKLTENNDKTNKTNAAANNKNGAETIVPAVADSQVTGQAGGSSARGEGQNASKTETRGDDNSGQGGLNFLTKKVADKHIADNDLTDTHHAVKDGKRWYVVEKPTTTQENPSETKTNETNAANEAGQRQEGLLDDAAPNTDVAGAVNSIPKVAAPLKIGTSETNNKSLGIIKGSEYLFPNNEDLPVIITKPTGNKSKSTKIGYTAYDKKSGEMIYSHPSNGNNENVSESDVVDIVYNMFKNGFGNKVREHHSNISKSKESNKPETKDKDIIEPPVNSNNADSDSINAADNDIINQEEYSRKLSEYETEKSNLENKLKELELTKEILKSELDNNNNITIADIENSGINLKEVKVNGEYLASDVIKLIKEKNIEERIQNYKDFIKCLKG